MTTTINATAIRRNKGSKKVVEMNDRDFTTCSWYALCDNEATLLVRHAILGGVPTCQRCADRHDLWDRIDNATPVTEQEDQ